MVRHDGAPVMPAALAPIARAMPSWGPDGHGQWCGNSAGLGHLMLHVTPESLHERLPGSIRSAPHLVITASARIDNRDELFDALGVPGAGRDQTPDSSLILLAYEHWGDACVTRLLGDFAFAIWDIRKRRLFCARDPFGSMPFVYHDDGQRFVFASDIKGVLATVASPRLNEQLLAAYLQIKTYHAEKTLTFYEGVVKLPPAHTLTVNGGKVQLSKYWSPENAAEVRFANENDYGEQMLQLFQESVARRLRSAYPIGSHLSGGLDSSAVTVVAARALREVAKPLAVFSWSPDPTSEADRGPDSEHARINAICLQENLVCQYSPATKATLIESFQRDFTMEPTAMMPYEAAVQLKARAQGLRVILSGWGGDEAVSAHTSTYLAEFFINGQWPELGNAIRLQLNGSGNGQPLSTVRKSLGILRDLTVPRLPDSLYSLAVRSNFPAHQSPCIQPDFGRRYQNEVRDLRGPAWRFLPGVRETMGRHLEIGNIPMRLEHWVVSGARHQLVYRYPMLDKRLVEFVFGVPTSQFCGPFLRRSLFRSAVSALLPDADWGVAKRSPASRDAMQRDYFQAHSDWARQLASNSNALSASRFVDPERIHQALRSYTSSQKPVSLSGIREAFGCYAIKY